METKGAGCGLCRTDWEGKEMVAWKRVYVPIVALFFGRALGVIASA